MGATKGLWAQPRIGRGRSHARRSEADTGHRRMVSTFPHTEFRIGLQRLSVTSCHEMSFVININSTEATTPTSKHRHLGKCNYVLTFNCVLSSFYFFFLPFYYDIFSYHYALSCNVPTFRTYLFSSQNSFCNNHWTPDYKMYEIYRYSRYYIKETCKPYDKNQFYLLNFV